MDGLVRGQPCSLHHANHSLSEHRLRVRGMSSACLASAESCAQQDGLQGNFEKEALDGHADLIDFPYHHGMPVLDLHQGGTGR